MIMEEFKEYKILEDKNNPFSTLYQLPSGEKFYIEPVFCTQLQGFKEQFADKYNLIIEELIKMVISKKQVVFTGNFDCPLTNVDGFCYLEITDITDLLKIYAEDKSRGSDYGD